MTKPANTDYKARQQALRAERKAAGYYTPEQTAARAAAAKARAEYNARIASA